MVKMMMMELMMMVKVMMEMATTPGEKEVSSVETIIRVEDRETSLWRDRISFQESLRP